MTIGGIHLLDGQAGPGLVAEFHSKTTYDVTVAKGENKVLDIPNDKKTQLIVLKKDAQTGQLLAGATIKATQYAWGGCASTIV